MLAVQCLKPPGGLAEQQARGVWAVIGMLSGESACLRCASTTLPPSSPFCPPWRAGWKMLCPFPGDLFVQFPSLQRLYVSYNNFTVRRHVLQSSRGAG